MRSTDLFVTRWIGIELRRSLRDLSWSDLAWLGLGGGLLLTLAVGEVAIALHRQADRLRQLAVLWHAALPLAAFGLGAATGWALAGVALARAEADCLAALPLADRARRRAAAVAALVLGGPCVGLVAVASAAACLAIRKEPILLWTAVASLAFGVGAAVSASRRICTSAVRRDAAGSLRGVRVPGLVLDRPGIAWVGSWAWGLRAGRLLRLGRVVAGGVAGGSILAILVITSFVHRVAAPAAIGGTLLGLLVFMATVRMQPLASSVLRSAPLGFARAWLRLLRLPFLLSFAVFTVPASAAVAAEPAAWGAPLAGGLGLVACNLAYAVFAAYFLSAPLLAAVGFLSAVAYANYESVEYGRPVLLALAALIAWLWHLACRRYRRG